MNDMDYHSIIKMADSRIAQHVLPDGSQMSERRFRALQLHERILLIADIARHAGTAILMSLWEMYLTGLWMEFVPRGVGDFEFRDYVDTYHDELSRDYHQDMVRIIERVFQRCHSEVIELDGQRVTPELLVENNTMRALKKVSQKLARVDDEKAAELITMVAEGKDEDAIERAACADIELQHVLPEYSISLLADGTWEVLMTGLDDGQLAIFRQLVGAYAVERLTQGKPPHPAVTRRI